MWLYETDENPKRKHHWNNDFAGQERVGSVVVSKCPAHLSHDQAQDLLNSGFEYYPPATTARGYPGRIYAVLNGVVYRATPTNPGSSYHGFPELRDNLPPAREVREAIIQLARQDGSEEEVLRWLK